MLLNGLMLMIKETGIQEKGMEIWAKETTTFINALGCSCIFMYYEIDLKQINKTI